MHLVIAFCSSLIKFESQDGHFLGKIKLFDELFLMLFLEIFTTWGITSPAL